LRGCARCAATHEEADLLPGTAAGELKTSQPYGNQ